VLVLTGDAAALKQAFERAHDAGIHCAIYTQELFETDNDVDNRAAVRAVQCADLCLAGFSAYGPRKGIDRALKGLRLHA
jgi:hypothetical protein